MWQNVYNWWIQRIATAVFIFQLLYEFKIFQNKLAKGRIEGRNTAAPDIFLYTVAKKKKKRERDCF